jgi:UDP-glucose 4-epimerase
MPERVLVTGGAGFIGSHVVAAHRGAGDAVTVLDDLSSGRREHVPDDVPLVVADVRSAEARACVAEGGFTVVNHHAAQIDVRRSVQDPVHDASVNVLGLLNVLEGARAGGVRRVIFSSSGGTVYGEGIALPSREDAPKLPASPYGTAKLAAEYYLAMFGLLYGIEGVALRYSNVYGPRQDPHGEAGVVAIFARRLLAGEPLTIFGTGEQTRDLVYAGDVAQANVLASRVALAPLTSLDARAYNVGTGVETSVNRLAAVLGEAAGRAPEVQRAPARLGELERSVLDPAKAAAQLGWRPGHTLAQGVRATFEWFRDGSR